MACEAPTDRESLRMRKRGYYKEAITFLSAEATAVLGKVSPLDKIIRLKFTALIWTFQIQPTCGG